MKFGTVSPGRYTDADRYTGVAVGRRSTVQLLLFKIKLVATIIITYSYSIHGWTGKDGSPSPTLGTIIKILW